MQTRTAQRIKGNIGIWYSDRYPIGGDFGRVDPLGHEISHVIRTINPPYHGCNIEVGLIGGRTAATNTQHVENVDIHY